MEHERQYEVKIDSAPQGATIRVDGALTGVTPWGGKLSKGDHTIELTLEGFEKATRVFDVKESRKEQELFVPMIRKA